MGVNDWINALSGMVTQLAAIATQLGNLNTTTGDGLGSLSTSVSSLSTSLNLFTSTFSSLSVVVIELSFLMGLIVIAYWKKFTEIYILAALASLLFGFQWIGQAQWLYLGVTLMAIGLFLFVRGAITTKPFQH